MRNHSHFMYASLARKLAAPFFQLHRDSLKALQRTVSQRSFASVQIEYYGSMLFHKSLSLTNCTSVCSWLSRLALDLLNEMYQNRFAWGVEEKNQPICWFWWQHMKIGCSSTVRSFCCIECVHLCFSSCTHACDNARKKKEMYRVPMQSGKRMGIWLKYFWNLSVFGNRNLHGLLFLITMFL